MRYATAHIPPLPGVLKGSPGDFRVEELLAYEPSGSGDHLYVRIERQGLATFSVCRLLAAALGVPERAVGYAGLNDLRALTIQTFSAEHADEARLERLDPRLRVVSVSRHRNKIKLGHLKGNRFTILLAETPPGRLRDAAEALACLSQGGLPNRFGPQRFGRGGLNPALGRLLLAGDAQGFVDLLLGARRPGESAPAAEARARYRAGDLQGALAGLPRSEETRILERLAAGVSPERALAAASRRYLSLLVNALQAEAFNRVLELRMGEQQPWELQAGDVAWLHRNGACFLVEDPVAEAPRAAAFEISPTGPLPGPAMLRPRGAPGQVEEAVFRELAICPEAFGCGRGYAQKGARRPLRVPVGEAGVEQADGGLRFAFTLPPGAYATVLMEEIGKEGLRLSGGEPESGADG